MINPDSVAPWLKDLKIDLQPYQQAWAKQMGILTGELAVAMRKQTVAFNSAAKTTREFNRIYRWLLLWKSRHERFQTYGMIRPNGRPRRSGHRHKGMAAWRGHYD